MPDLQQSTDAELEELLASEVGDRKKAIAAEILRRRQEAKVKKWSGGNLLLAGLLRTSWPVYLRSSDGSVGSRESDRFSAPHVRLGSNSAEASWQHRARFKFRSRLSVANLMSPGRANSG
jgi:hypothetical protein